MRLGVPGEYRFSTLLATTYDVDVLQVTHCLDGRPLSVEAIPGEYLVGTASIGNASLGCWGPLELENPHFAVLNLEGSMTEFALFNAALSATEIEDIYSYGRP